MISPTPLSFPGHISVACIVRTSYCGSQTVQYLSIELSCSGRQFSSKTLHPEMIKASTKVRHDTGLWLACIPFAPLINFFQSPTLPGGAAMSCKRWIQAQKIRMSIVSSKVEESRCWPIITRFLGAREEPCDGRRALKKKKHRVSEAARKLKHHMVLR